MGKPPTTYPETTAEQIGSKLERLAQHPKGLQVKEIVARLKPKIEAAQEAGYTLNDIVDVFKAEGVTLTLNTLKQYLRESRSLPSSSESHPSPTPKTKPPRSAKSGKAETPTHTQPPPSSSLSNAAEAEAHEPEEISGTNEAGFQQMRSNDDL